MTAAQSVQKLGVANLIEGSVRKQGDRVRDRRGANQCGRWTLALVGDLRSRIEGCVRRPGEIAKSVAEQMKVKLLGERPLSDAAPSNQNPAAYNAVLQSDFYFQQLTAESLRAPSVSARSGPAGSELRACLRASYHRHGANSRPASPQTMPRKRTRKPAKPRIKQLASRPIWSKCEWRSAVLALTPDLDFRAAEKSSDACWNPRPATPLRKVFTALHSRPQGRLAEAEQTCREALSLDPLRDRFLV